MLMSWYFDWKMLEYLDLLLDDEYLLTATGLWENVSMILKCYYPLALVTFEVSALVIAIFLAGLSAGVGYYLFLYSCWL